ncbi:hypothetical protein K438DRAFT_1967202 [Mycena galopus ATCC 62051]|nr:hypothetical protein K438DRAFT_1967202 [Mycena galopus ATCC 62051]
MTLAAPTRYQLCVLTKPNNNNNNNHYHHHPWRWLSFRPRRASGTRPLSLVQHPEPSVTCRRGLGTIMIENPSPPSSPLLTFRLKRKHRIRKVFSALRHPSLSADTLPESPVRVNRVVQTLPTSSHHLAHLAFAGPPRPLTLPRQGGLDPINILVPWPTGMSLQFTGSNALEADVLDSGLAALSLQPTGSDVFEFEPLGCLSMSTPSNHVRDCVTVIALMSMLPKRCRAELEEGLDSTPNINTRTHA